jgi:GTP cyclohydrolase IB
MMASTVVDLLPDVQATGDERGVALDVVGISGLTLPVVVGGVDGSECPSIAEVELSVGLGAEMRGTHMSRFVEEATALGVLTPASVLSLAEALCARLDTQRSAVCFGFPHFIERPAPITGLVAPHRYHAWIAAEIDRHKAEPISVTIGVRAAITSLCPCSREISDYGAHSQRGEVVLHVEAPGWRDGESIWPQEVFAFADHAGSAQVHPLLKRSDERAVTMLAYDQPAFVEDIARDVVVAVKADDRCHAWDVRVVNQESIHDHQAVAQVRGRR